MSELLYTPIGGKSVRPAIPKGVVEVSYGSSIKWPEATGRDRYRRGLYTLFQRTVPYPMLINFDAPDANTAACRRERSNTPLQALNLLNDPVFVEAAQALACPCPSRDPPGRCRSPVRNRARPARRVHASANWVRRLSPHGRFNCLSKNPKQAEEFFPVELPGHARVEDRSLDSAGERHSQPGRIHNARVRTMRLEDHFSVETRRDFFRSRSAAWAQWHSPTSWRTRV